jgi:hypothetical protein
MFSNLFSETAITKHDKRNSMLRRNTIHPPKALKTRISGMQRKKLTPIQRHSLPQRHCALH